MKTVKLGALAWSATLMTALLGVSPGARAFTEPRSYVEAPENGGGGGRFFTGSLAEGYGCSVCHSGQAPEPLLVRGLPEDGYEPGGRYDLRVGWPKFAERASELRETQDDPPAMGLVLELVADTGIGAGSLELASEADAEPEELCVLPEGRLAALLFTVRPGQPIREQGRSCEALDLGERCVAAVLSCGASELRVRWTAPAEPQGAIWLSAGFVATDRVSGDPFEDAVTELAQPVLPAGSKADYPVSELSASCRALPSRGARSLAAPALLLGALGMLTVRARRRAKS
jgi:hypothetical protein